MGLPVHIVIDTAAANRRVQDLRGRFSSFQPVLGGPVKQLIHEAIVQNYESEGRYASPDGWAQLSDYTIDRKARAGKSSLQTLDFGNRLSRFVHNIDGFGKDYDIKPRSFTIRWTNAVAGYHQRGHALPTPLPQRSIIPNPFPESFVARLRNLVRRYLIEAIVE